MFFYLTVLGGESFFAADHITKRTFLSLLNEIYSLLLPVQLDKLELVCQSAVYQGGTCYQKAARLETQESGWSLWSNQNVVCLRALGREKQMTWKVRRQKKMSVSEKWLTARPVYAKDRGFSQAFLCSPGCQLKHAEEQEQSGLWAWSRTSWAEQKDSGG